MEVDYTEGIARIVGREWCVRRSAPEVFTATPLKETANRVCLTPLRAARADYWVSGMLEGLKAGGLVLDRVNGGTVLE